MLIEQITKQTANDWPIKIKPHHPTPSSWIMNSRPTMLVLNVKSVATSVSHHHLLSNHDLPRQHCLATSSLNATPPFFSPSHNFIPIVGVPQRTRLVAFECPSLEILWLIWFGTLWYPRAYSPNLILNLGSIWTIGLCTNAIVAAN